MKVILDLCACAFMAFSLYVSFSFLNIFVWGFGLFASLWKLYKCGEALAAVEIERKVYAFRNKLFNDTLNHIQETFDANVTADVNEFIKSRGADIASQLKK